MASANSGEKIRIPGSELRDLAFAESFCAFNTDITDWSQVRMAYRSGQWLPFIILITTPLIRLFLVPLKTTLFTFTQDGTWWDLVISRHVAFALIAIYLLMFAVVSIVAYKLWQCTTGLKWDPTSIADQLALVQKSNLL